MPIVNRHIKELNIGCGKENVKRKEKVKYNKLKRTTLLTADVVITVMSIFLVQRSDLKVASGARGGAITNQQAGSGYGNPNSLSSVPVVRCNPKSGESSLCLSVTCYHTLPLRLNTGVSHNMVT